MILFENMGTQTILANLENCLEFANNLRSAHNLRRRGRSLDVSYTMVNAEREDPEQLPLPLWQEELLNEAIRVAGRTDNKNMVNQVGVDRQAIENWKKSKREDGHFYFSRGPNGKTLNKLREKFNGESKLLLNSDNLFSSVLKMLGLSEKSQAEFDDLIGIYECYRLSVLHDSVTGQRKLHTGQIEFHRDASTGISAFKHTSRQNVTFNSGKNADVTFDHEGIVVLVKGRIYILGIGLSSGQEYIRPMILRHRAPRKQPLIGILLTEHHTDNEPMSMKTVLFRSDLENIEHHRQSVYEYLANESGVSDIVIGWDRVHSTRENDVLG